MTLLRALAMLAALASGSIVYAAATEIAEPAGYRLEDYRAPVPATVAGGRAIDTAEAQRLWLDKRAIFVDVLGAPRRPGGLRADAPWLPLPRMDIPGSLWLPDVGRGEIGPALDDYFRSVLATATKGDKAAPLVFYCLADCWMSWNATKRAASYGYTELYWYRDGTTGWEAAHLATQQAEPAPGRP